MRRARIEKVAEAFQGWPGLYVIGAGASAPVLPMTSQLITRVQKLYWDGGVFPASEPSPQDFRSRRFIGMATAKRDPISDIMVEITPKMSSGFVQDALLQITASARNSYHCPPNYGVFRLFPHSQLLNYNLDGLAEKWCRPRHLVTTMHGQPSAIYGTSLGRARMEAAQLYNLAAVAGHEIMLEPETLLHDLPIPYRLQRSRFVTLIGYSFSRNNGGMDDFVSFKRVCASLARDPRPVLVIDPAAEAIADMVAEETKSAQVYAAPLYWNVMASSIILMQKRGWSATEAARAYDLCGDRLL